MTDELEQPFHHPFTRERSENASLKDEITRLQADNRRWSKVADERSKENCELRQLLRDARDHVPWDVLKRIDAVLRNAEQTGDAK